MIRPVDRPRFGQLTYAAFDQAGSSSGGWHVQAKSGDLTEVELEALRKHATITFGEVSELPDFPSPEQLRALPRRLSHFPLYANRRDASEPERLGSAYVHSTPAGLDTTQRPGNVFSHLLIDRDPAASEQRPVQLWRSPAFRTPYGANAVAGSVLPDSAEFEKPGNYVTPSGVRRFIRKDAAQRLPVLAMLLDGTRAAVNGAGPNIVLGTDSPDRAAFWIGAVSMLTTDEWARLLGWSLFERAADLASAWSRGIHIAAVPRADLEHVDTSNTVIIDELSQGHSLGSFETYPPTPHTTAQGGRIPSSVWSELALYLLQVHPESLPQVLDRLEQIAAFEFTPEAVPEWALAMATVPLGSSDLDEITHDTIVQSTPASVSAVQWIHDDAVTAMQHGISADTAGSFERLRRAQPDPCSLGYSLLYRSYVEFALQDSDWMRRHGRAPLPEGPLPVLCDDRTLLGHAESAVLRALEQLRAGDDLTIAGAYALHLLELLIAVELLPEEPDFRRADERTLPGLAQELLNELVPRVLQDQHVWSAVAPYVEKLSESTRLHVSRTAYRLSGRERGLTPSAVVRWFRTPRMPQFVAEAEQRVREQAYENPASGRPPRIKLMPFDLVESEALDTGDTAYPWTLALGSLALAGGRWSGIPQPIARVLAQRLPDEPLLMSLIERWAPGQLDGRIIDLALLQADRSANLQRLISALRQNSGTGVAAAAGEVLAARMAAQRYLQDPSFDAAMSEHLQTLAVARSGLLADQRINFTVFAPYVVATAAYSELSSQNPLSAEQMQFVRDASGQARPELLVGAFLNLAGKSQKHTKWLIGVLVERSLIAAGIALPAVQYGPHPMHSPLDGLRVELPGQPHSERGLTVYDETLRQLCAHPNSYQASLLSSERDRILREDAQSGGEKDRRRNQKAIRKHFEPLEFRSLPLFGGLFKMPKTDEGT